MTNKDGFEVLFSRSGVQKDDCSGKERDSNGLCLCGGEAWGGDCSHTSFCIGTTRVKMREEAHILRSSSRVTEGSLSSANISRSVIGEDAYPNDLDCIYELDFGDFDSKGELFARIEISYDLEETFDYLELLSGSGQSSLKYNVLSGQSLNEVFFVPVDAKSGMASLRLITDDKGRRRGFYAKVSAEYLPDRSLTCEVGRFGSLCESVHCLSRNAFHQSDKGIRVTSQDDSSFVRAMPWATDGGCVWEMPPSHVSTGAIRINITKFDLEPYPSKMAGDKVIIKSGDNNNTELFSEFCKTNETCSAFWQTGYCTDGKWN